MSDPSGVVLGSESQRVVFDPAALGQAHEESTEGSGASPWEGFSLEDQQRVEALFAAGLTKLEQEKQSHGGDRVIVAPNDKAASLLQSSVEQLAAYGLVDTTSLTEGTAEAVFDNQDVRWVKALYGLLKNKLHIGEFRWVAPSSTPTPIPDDCRIAVLGDWGTGLYGAPKCAQSIAADGDGFDLVIHLGDVYYSGTAREVERNFLAHWPWQTKPHSATSVTFRACNSNHEMYSGGKPYLEAVRLHFSQLSSACALENKKWLLVGLDTAYNEWHVRNKQVEWLDALLARDDGRKVILFSHHMGSSHFDDIQGSLHQTIEQLSTKHNGKIHAWYWGHEHIGAIYDWDPTLQLNGRCVGHSGFPYFREESLTTLVPVKAVDTSASDWIVRVPSGKAPAAWIVEGPNSLVDPGIGTAANYGPNGYMTLDLVDGTIHETLRTATGLELWRGDI